MSPRWDKARVVCMYRARRQQELKLEMSHVFIDEAAQASEPSALIPITGLLAPRGLLVLAGDPRQLGPVCISREAHRRGLGTFYAPYNTSSSYPYLTKWGRYHMFFIML
jgi:hypothetical protein